MKKNIFYFSISVFLIVIGIYYLNHAGNNIRSSSVSLIKPVVLSNIEKGLEKEYKETTSRKKIEKTIPELTTKIIKKGTRLNPFFSPKDNIRDIIIEHINNETRSIACAAFRLTDPMIAKSIQNAHEKGIKIVLVIDKEGFSAMYSKLLFLFTKHIPVFIYPPITFENEKMQKREGLMHNKFICFESQETVITGSFNYTKSAQDVNQENILVVEDRETYKKYNDHFAYLKTISSPLEAKNIKKGINKKKKRS